MNLHSLSSTLDWREITQLRTQFRCASRSGPGDDALAIDIARQPFVPVRINGEGSFSMVFETGHTGYLLDPSCANLALVCDEHRMAGLDTFAIGDTCWHGMRIGLDDLSDTSRFLRRPVHGLLGNLFWMIHGLTPTIDYPGRRLSLMPDDEPTRASSDAVSAPMAIIGFRPFVHVELNGRGPFLFHVDTGAAFCLLSKAVSETLGLRLGEPCRLRGTRIDDPARDARVDRLSVGAAQLRDFPVKVSMETLLIEKNVRCSVDGTIGATFLEHFSVTFDYGRGRLGLSRVPA